MYKQDLASMMGGRIRYTRFIIGYLDLQATSGSGAKSVTLADADNPAPWTFGLSAGSKILGVSVVPTVAFAGGSLSALTMSLGVSGSLTRFTSAYDVFAAVSATNLQETAMFKAGTTAAITALLATFTPTGDSCSVATAGAVNLDIAWIDMTTTGALPA